MGDWKRSARPARGLRYLRVHPGRAAEQPVRREQRASTTLEGLCVDFLGEPEEARRAYEAARSLLEEELEGHPKDHLRYPALRSALGLAYAGPGLPGEGRAGGEEAVAFLLVSRDELAGPLRLEDLALIYTTVGEHDAALDKIETLLSVPSWLSVRLFQLDPRWAPLHKHPRFQALLGAAPLP